MGVSLDNSRIRVNLRSLLLALPAFLGLAAGQSFAQSTLTISEPVASYSVAPEGYSLVYPELTLEGVASVTYSVSEGLVIPVYQPFYYASRGIEVSGSSLIRPGSTIRYSGSAEAIEEIFGDVDSADFAFQPLPGSRAAVSVQITASDSAGVSETRSMLLRPTAPPRLENVAKRIAASASGAASLDLSAMRLADKGDQITSMMLLIASSDGNPVSTQFSVSSSSEHGVTSLSFTLEGEGDCSGDSIGIRLQGTTSQFARFFSEPANLSWQYLPPNNVAATLNISYSPSEDDSLEAHSTLLLLPIDIGNPIALRRLGRPDVSAAIDELRVGSTQWFSVTGLDGAFSVGVAPAGLGIARIQNSLIAVSALSPGEGELVVTQASGEEHRFALSFAAIGGVERLGTASAGADDATVFEGGVSRDFGENFSRSGVYYPNDELQIYFRIRPDESHVGAAAGFIIAVKNEAQPESIFILRQDGSLQSYAGGEIAYFSRRVLKESNELDLSAAFPFVIREGAEGKWSVFVGYQLPDGRLVHSADAVEMIFE